MPKFVHPRPAAAEPYPTSSSSSSGASSSSSAPAYHGEATCTLCERKAYYSVGAAPRCGRHASKDTRRALPKNPQRAVDADTERTRHTATVDAATRANGDAGRRGDVICTPIRGMFGTPEQVDGYRTVLPNFKHGNSTLGRGLARLSPKSLGPVDMQQPDHPPATSIENLHQFSKVWPFELGADGKLTAEARRYRLDGYANPAPQRHKYDKATLRRHSPDGNANVPAFSLYFAPDGAEVRLTYVESRYVYCYWMERLVRLQPQFAELNAWVSGGINVNLSGYDGYRSEGDGTPAERHWRHYLDGSRPYGHEKVLEAMLVIDAPADYPWNRYRREHPDLYDTLALPLD